MLLILIATLVLGSLILRNRTLPQGTTEVIEPSVKTVRASVDGKPVYSYVKVDADKR